MAATAILVPSVVYEDCLERFAISRIRCFPPNIRCEDFQVWEQLYVQGDTL